MRWTGLCYRSPHEATQSLRIDGIWPKSGRTLQPLPGWAASPWAASSTSGGLQDGMGRSTLQAYRVLGRRTRRAAPKRVPVRESASQSLFRAASSMPRWKQKSASPATARGLTKPGLHAGHVCADRNGLRTGNPTLAPPSSVPVPKERSPQA